MMTEWVSHATKAMLPKLDTKYKYCQLRQYLYFELDCVVGAPGLEPGTN